MIEAIIAFFTFFSVQASPPTKIEEPFVALEAKPMLILPIETPIQEIAIEEAKPSESVFDSCVRFLREVKGIPLPVIAFAKDLKPNITFSQIRKGDIIILNFKPHGHIAEILEIRNNGVYVDQANKKAGQRTQEVIPYEHFPKFVIGFYRPENTVTTAKNAL